MKLVIDARLLGEDGRGRHLRKIAGCWLRDANVEAVGFLGSTSELEVWLSEQPGAAKARLLPWGDPVGSVRAHLRWMVRGRGWTEGFDAAFFPHSSAPVGRPGRPVVIAAPDLAHLLAWEAPAWKRGILRFLRRRALRRAALVLTDSRASRDELVAAFPWLEPRIRVIPNGVDRKVFRPLAERERVHVVAQWSPYRPFLLVTGPIEARKGVATALRALGALRGLRPELQLVHVGPSDIRDREVRRLLSDPHLESRFTRLGPVDDTRLNALYNSGECLLHPGESGGIGLPPLEAMASGMPVLASDRLGVAEVSEGAAVLLDPEDLDGWARAILQIMDGGPERDRRIRLGIERTRELSWNQTASETLEALRGAVGVAS